MRQACDERATSQSTRKILIFRRVIHPDLTICTVTVSEQSHDAYTVSNINQTYRATRKKWFRTCSKYSTTVFFTGFLSKLYDDRTNVPKFFCFFLFLSCICRTAGFRRMWEGLNIKSKRASLCYHSGKCTTHRRKFRIRSTTYYIMI